MRAAEFGLPWRGATDRDAAARKGVLRGLELVADRAVSMDSRGTKLVGGPGRERAGEHDGAILRMRGAVA